MADVDLYGYGPHALVAGNDYYLKAVNGNAKGRREQLTIGIDISAGNISVLSRERGGGSAVALEAQSYKKADETLAAAAIAADASVRVDATSKDIVLRTAALTVANVYLALDTDV